MLARFLYDERGKARPRRMIGLFATVVPLALFGSFLLALTPVLSGHEGFQTMWVIFCVFLLKFPLVALLWWFIVRNKEWPGRPVRWSDEETREILAYLESEAARVKDLPDAGARLAYLQREAWNVADRVGGEVKAEAVDSAVHIDHMITRQRSPRSREG
jgi:hypothetical protein